MRERIRRMFRAIRRFFNRISDKESQRVMDFLADTFSDSRRMAR